jgi:Flp pilus assembly protein TadD
MRQKRAEPALEIARSAQTEMPKSPLGWTYEGDILVSQKKFKEAVAVFERALALAPSDAVAVRIYHARAVAGDKKGAVDGLRQWIQKHPEGLGARTQLASALLDGGDLEGAKKEYEIVANKAPNDPVVKNNLAWAYFKARDPRALKVAEQALRLRPNDPAIHDTLGWILVQQGNVARGTELLGIAAKGLPNEPSVRYRYAAGLAKSGAQERARAELSTALALGKPFAEREQAVALLGELKKR